MKPLINLRFGIWGCFSGTCMQDFVIGCGNTPQEAYEEWARQVKA